MPMIALPAAGVTGILHLGQALTNQVEAVTIWAAQVPLLMVVVGVPRDRAHPRCPALLRCIEQTIIARLSMARTITTK